jgi:hypothetical protein
LMIFNFLAGALRKRSERCAANRNIFQLLTLIITHDLYLDVQIHIQNVLGNAQAVTAKSLSRVNGRLVGYLPSLSSIENARPDIIAAKVGHCSATTRSDR